jgi:hypothetical protein
MNKGHLKFFTGKGIIDPDLSFGSERVPLIISPIEKRVIDLLTNLITIYYPDIITISFSPIVPIYTIDTFFIRATEQENNTNTEKKQIPQFHRFNLSVQR